jgi:hypothetical protein
MAENSGWETMASMNDKGWIVLRDVVTAASNDEKTKDEKSAFARNE